VKTIVAAWPEDGWTQLNAGDGAKGPRWYDWRRLPLADPLDPHGHRWLLVRSRVNEPTELRAYVVFAPQATTLEEVVQVAGTRWVIEQLFEAAKGEVGLDHYSDQVRERDKRKIWMSQTPRYDEAPEPPAMGERRARWGYGYQDKVATGPNPSHS
jgi:hypothetical protein